MLSIPLSLPITSVYGGVLAIGYSSFSLAVALHRKKTQLSTGDGGDTGKHKGFAQQIRAQANYGEYAPFVVTLMALMEAQQVVPSKYLHALGATFTVMRIMHSLQMWYPQRLPIGCRVLGFMNSYATTLIGGVVLLVSGLKAL